MNCGDFLVKYLIIYFAVISLITAVVTLADKRSAHRGGQRVSEAMLILLALLGGALAELVVMKKIRHKTLHKKFMVGLPLIIFLHIALIVSLFFI